mgnify:CR=1 FL=1
MGFIEALLGSGISGAIALKATADAFKEESTGLGMYYRPESPERTGIQKELLDRALKAIKREKHQEAIPLLIRAIKLDPYYPIYFSTLGNCYLSLGQYDIALECYDKTLDLDGKVYVITDEARKSIRYLSRECEKLLKANTDEVQVPTKEGEMNVEKETKTTKVGNRTKGATPKSKK